MMSNKKEGDSREANRKEAATDQSLIGVPNISLPKGGGAIRGIGEKFSLNPVTGTASLSFPVFTPHSRANFLPPLSLSYDSGAGNSPFGFGWHLSTPSITRKTDKGLPRYQDGDESDVFILSEAEDLVPTLIKNGNAWNKDTFSVTLSGLLYTVQRYRPRVEGLFARIEKISVQGETGFYWKVTTKENVVTIFGRTAAARIADPDNAARIYKWLPEWSYDDKGNCIQFSFKPENLDRVPDALCEKNRRSGLARFTNKYLKKIRYGNKTPYYADATNPYRPDLPANPEYFFEAVFDYGEHDESAPTPTESSAWKCRCDPFSDYRAGFEIRTYRLCKRILLFHYFTELNFTPSTIPEPCLVRSVDLSYKHFNFGSSPQPRQEADFITAIRQVSYKKIGANSYRTNSLPPLELTYHELEWNKSVKTIPPADLINAPIGIGPNYQWIDLYNEGVSGILSEQANGWYYKSNLGDGHFSPAKAVAPKPSFLGAASGALQFQDLDADGTRQVVVNEANQKGYFELSDDNHWLGFRSFEQMPEVNFSDPNTKFIDLNGDGRPDLVISEEQAFRWYPSLGSKGYDSPELASKPFDEEKGPAIVFADAAQSIYLADMSGDGMGDILRIRNGEVCYWPNMGYGRFGAKVTMENAPLFDYPELFNPSYIQLADVSGTGATDILYLGRNRFKAWLNLSGNALSDAQEIAPFPTTEMPNRLSVIDLLGNGTACIVWSSPLPQYESAPMRYVDLMGGQKPYILSGYKNNLGSETKLKYKSSTYYCLHDKAEGKPWATKLPFPVHCLSEVELRDTVNNLYFVNEYRYHHGYYDHSEREFRGFGMVEQLDTQTFEHFRKSGATNVVSEPLHQPPVLTKSWFHTGAFTRKGKILRQFEDDYYKNPYFVEHHLPDIEIQSDAVALSKITPDELRQAYRACKGMILRQEVYALDGSADALHPYSVAEHNCHIRLLQPAAGVKHAVFLSHESEAITYHYERKPADPRISHTLNTDLDKYGNVSETASVVYARPHPDTALASEILREQAKIHITYTKNGFTEDRIDSAAYRLRLPCETQTFELTGAPPNSSYYTPSELRTAFSDAAPLNYEDNPAGTIAQKRLIEHERILYAKNSDVNAPLPLGQLESLGLRYETYKLAFTPALLTQLYDAKMSDAILIEGRYVKSNDYKANGLFPTTDHDDYWWIPSGILQYPANPAQHFYLPDRHIDPFGATTKVKYYSNYHLLIEETEDALGNKITAESFDFRFLQPQSVKDINDNINEVRFDILGLVVGAAIKGKGSEADDFTDFNPDLTQTQIDAFYSAPETHGASLLQHASSRFVYDLTKTPACAATILRETHHRTAIETGTASKLQFTFEYSNGMGQVVLKKIQAEPGKAKKGELHAGGTYTVTEVDTTPHLRWVGNGRTVLNNKGKAVKQYEPYFSVTHLYEAAAELVEIGVTPVVYYDPLGRAIKTEFPNGTFSKVEFDAWRQRTFDQNDTVRLSDWHAARIGGSMGPQEQDAAEKAELHDDTPTVTHLDSLGRTFYTVAHNKYRDRATTLIREEFHKTQVEFDIEGNQRLITDARANTVMQYAYDMLGHQVYQKSMDSGERWLLNDSMGKALYGWDSMNNRFHTKYDALHRPTEHEVLTPAPKTIVYEKSEYGTDKLKNQNGQLVKHYDGSGVITHDAYDFKGNDLERTRQFTLDYDKRPDWKNVAAVILRPTSFKTSTEFDALNRPVKITTPDNSRTVPEYNESNLLDKVRVSIRGAAEKSFVSNINYDAKGQRQKIEYGNHSFTTYDYDPLTFHLKHLLTIRTTDSEHLQDLNYTYDPVGNITKIEDLAQQTVYFNNDVVLAHNDFTYDALYRLIAATGREHIGEDAPVSELDEFRTRLTHKGDSNAMRNYLQQYEYDFAGNMLKMVHAAGRGSFTNRWTREFTYEALNNRLASTTVGTTTVTYQYDLHGNMIKMPHLSAMNWDFLDHLESVDLIGGGTAYYNYDAEGNRTRKVIKRLDGTIEERLYLGAFEIFTKTQGGTVQLRRETLHVMDDKRRIAMVDTRTSDTDAPVQLIRYQYGNHLGTAALELDDVPSIISYEEHYPFGSTSYQAVDSAREVPARRYRYTGKERDEESGFYYHGARYYAPWLARWISVDPALLEDYAKSDQEPYSYVKNRPTIAVDPDGRFLWFLAAAIIIAVVATPQIANAPGPRDTPTTRSTGELALNMAENAVTIYTAPRALAGGAAMMAEQGIVRGGLTVGRNIVVGQVRSRAVQGTADVIDPSGNLGRAVNVGLGARGALRPAPPIRGSGQGAAAPRASAARSLLPAPGRPASAGVAPSTPRAQVRMAAAQSSGNRGGARNTVQQAAGSTNVSSSGTVRPPSSSSGPGSGGGTVGTGRVFYHYTDVDPATMRGGMYTQSSYTTVGNLTPAQARTQLGIPTPRWVLVFTDDGRFRPLGTGTVQPNPNRGFVGGAPEYYHPGRPSHVHHRRIGP